jgi:hypothetical protein
MIRALEKSNDLIGNRTRDLPTCIIVPQPTTLPRVPEILKTFNTIYFPSNLQYEDENNLANPLGSADHTLKPLL